MKIRKNILSGLLIVVIILTLPLAGMGSFLSICGCSGKDEYIQDPVTFSGASSPTGGCEKNHSSRSQVPCPNGNPDCGMFIEARQLNLTSLIMDSTASVEANDLKSARALFPNGIPDTLSNSNPLIQEFLYLHILTLRC
jgi:hypothetical protein